MPRALLILTEFPPRIGGMQTHAAYLSRYLANHGYQVDVFTHRVTDPSQVMEAQVYDAAQPFPVRRVLGRLSYLHNLELIARHAKRFAPDLIYASTVYYGCLQERTGIPVFCRSVGNDVMRPWLGYPWRFGSRLLNSARVERLLSGWLERQSYPDWVEALFRRQREALTVQSARAATRIFANSRYTAERLHQAGVADERIRILPGGVDSARFVMPATGKTDQRRMLGLPEHAFLLMTACRLVAKKGIELLIEALPRLQQAIPHVHLVIVGDGKYRTRYERECAARGITAVTFAGRVPHDDIHHYYAACDLFVLASRESINTVTGTRDVETMGRVLCEANAAGVPVLASRSGGIPSVVEDGVNGMLFDEENVEQLAAKIDWMYHHPDVRHELVRHGLRRAREDFDWKNILRAHLETFGHSAAGASTEKQSGVANARTPAVDAA